MNQQQMGAPQITEQNVRDAWPVKCECGSMVFEEKMMFKKISPLISSTGKVEFYPINLVICTSCGLMPSIFNVHNIIPKELLTKTIK